MPRHSNVLRDAIIFAMYAHHPLAEIAATYNLSRQRVHQIILKAEAGGALRAPRHKRGPHRAERVVWKCAICGTERKILKCGYRPHISCGNCYWRRLDFRAEQWIAARLRGASWAGIARAAGIFGSNRINRVPRCIFLYLRRTNRLNEIPQIWRGGSARWLFKQYSKPRLHGESQ